MARYSVPGSVKKENEQNVKPSETKRRYSVPGTKIQTVSKDSSNDIGMLRAETAAMRKNASANNAKSGIVDPPARENVSSPAPTYQDVPKDKAGINVTAVNPVVPLQTTVKSGSAINMGQQIPEPAPKKNWVSGIGQSVAAGLASTAKGVAKIDEFLTRGSINNTPPLTKALSDLIFPGLDEKILKSKQNRTASFESTEKYYANKANENASSAQQFAFGGVQAASAMLPNIILSVLSGGTTTAATGIANATSSGIPGLSKGAISSFGSQLKEMIPFMTQAAGGYARDAELQGATPEQQLAYGIAGGLSEGMTEMLPMGALKKALGVGDDVAKGMIKKGTNNLIKDFGKKGLQWFVNAGEQVIQEAAVEPMTGLAAKAIYEYDKPFVGQDGLIDFGQMGEAAKGALAMSLVLTALGFPVNAISRTKAKSMVGKTFTEKDIQSLYDAVQKDTAQQEVTAQDAMPVKNTIEAEAEAELQKEITTPKPADETERLAEELRNTEPMEQSAKESSSYVETLKKIRMGLKVGSTEYKAISKVINDLENKSSAVKVVQDGAQKTETADQKQITSEDTKANKEMAPKQYLRDNEVEDIIKAIEDGAIPAKETVKVENVPAETETMPGELISEPATPKSKTTGSRTLNDYIKEILTVQPQDGLIRLQDGRSIRIWKRTDGWSVAVGDYPNETSGNFFVPNAYEQNGFKTEDDAIAAAAVYAAKTQPTQTTEAKEPSAVSENNVPNAFKGADPGDIDYKTVKVGMQTQTVNSTPSGTKTPKFEFSDPEIEKVHVRNRGVRPETLANKVQQGWNEFKNMFTRPIKTLPVKGNERIYYGKDGLINLSKAKTLAGDETTRIIKDIQKSFNNDKNAYDMFSRKVLLDDLMEDVKLGNALPNKWTPEAVEMELDRLDNAMPDSVREAIAKRKQAWDEVKDRYIKAMDAVGVNMEEKLSRENYFRHQVLDYMDMKNAVSGVGKKVQTPSNRGFTKGRTGEYTGNINTDYIQAEYEVMAQMLHDEKVAKFIKLVDDTKNIADKVKADAKAQGIKDWHRAIPEGYAAWQPREGNFFYLYKPVAEDIVEGALSLRKMTLSDIKDPKIRTILEDIMNDLSNQREVLALGGKRKEFVIPQELAETLDNMARNKATGRLAKYFQATHSMWKRWVLYLNPRNAFKYGARNAVGDLDAVIAGNPSGLSKTFRSMTELMDAMRNDKFTPELKTFYDMGGYQATQAAQEISQVNKLKAFEGLRDDLSLGEKMAKPFEAYEETMSGANEYREMILRYGSYLDYLEQLNSGKLKNYGASKKSIIDALPTNEEKAYKLADDLLGAYDDVSEAGKFLRRQFIPFYSWLETNFKRYGQLFRNALDTGDARAAAKTAGGAVVKGGLSMVRKMGGIFALTAILAAWNSLRYPDLEETLPDDVKSKPHLILGKDKDGKTIYFSRLGSLNDFAEWFGLDNAWQDGLDVLNGKKTIMEQLKDMVKSPVNKLLTGIRPEIKTLTELLSGKKFYPDVFDPSNIRDRQQYFAQTLGLGNEYNEIFNMPHKSYASTIADIFMYKSDPEEAAYWNNLDAKIKYQKSKGDTGEGFYQSNKSNALYNYKLALRYGDEKAQEKFIKLYESYGGNPSQTISSVLTMSPYYGIPTDERSAYRSSLTEKQKKNLELAENYFVKMLESELASKRNLSAGTKAMLDIYKRTGETKQFPKVISGEVTIDGKKIRLTQAEITDLQEKANERMYKKTDELVNADAFKKRTPEQRAELLSATLNAQVEIERNIWKQNYLKKQKK